MIVYGAVLGYVMSSAYFLHWPIHKRSRVRKPCRHISHRGGAAEGPENTLPAFDRAVAMGTDMLELDCHLSRDGVAVVVHDAHLLRLTGHDLRVAEVDFEQLPPLLGRLPIDFAPGQWYESAEGAAPARIASLAQVMARFPDVEVNIDIKVHDENLVREVSRVIAQYGAESRSVWGSFRQNTAELCYRTNPDIGLFASFPRVITILLLFYSGLLPFVPLRESHFEIPLPCLFVTTGPRGVLMTPGQRLLVRLTHFLLISPRLFAHLEKRGIQTLVWVLNQEDDFELAQRCGVSGIMTDYPSKLKLFQLAQGL